MGGSIVQSPRGTLSPQKTLKLANSYLKSADDADDEDITLVLCHNAEESLSDAKKAAKRTKDQRTIMEIGAAYIDLGNLLKSRGYTNEADVSFEKAVKLGANVSSPKGTSPHTRTSQSTGSIRPPPKNKHQQRRGAALIPSHIFTDNVNPPVMEFNLPEPDGRLSNTPQLAYCLHLLQANRSPDDKLDSKAQNWLQTTKKDPVEQERLETMATEVIRTFKKDEIKNDRAIAEVVYLAPAVSKDLFRDLLSEFYSEIDRSGLLKVHSLEGLAQWIQGADQGRLSPDDLVKILGLLSHRLKDTHTQSSDHVHLLTLAVSHVLDAMANTNVTGLDRENLHEPLTAYLKELKGSKDSYLVYQAAYAYQALLCVPDNEKAWQAALRRTGNVLFGLSGVAKAVKDMDLQKFIKSLESIHKGVAGAVEIVHTVVKATSLTESGQSFLECLKKNSSFNRKRAWYSALQGADALIRNGEFPLFRELVCDTPCRRDLEFQWGVCQRLGEIAANPMWDAATRQSAIDFLGEIYKNDEEWGRHVGVKQWILNILMQLTSASETDSGLRNVDAGVLLRELESVGDDKKQAMYRSCREKGPISYPLKVSQPELASPSLLDHVQNRPDVEGNIRLLRKQRTSERGNAVYIQPQAKSSSQAADTTRFLLMEKVKKFLDSDQKVFLLMGDSGTGKSTFNKELEFELWQSYTSKTGRIPLHINLPAIDKPEQDMIAKQLRRTEFTELQIREMKRHRKFILICDGYDESQQLHNLYLSNQLNLPGEWDARMVISCRTEYLGADYRDRFQPGDRNQKSDSSLFQEAVLTPFSFDQMEAYIQQYVTLHKPTWKVGDYKRVLESIPGLRDLVGNPFLMNLSLDVLPHIIDPEDRQSASRVTRVELYDHFVKQWLERGKKRMGEKDLSSQAREAFKTLGDDGFTRHGVDYLKKLAVAIYRHQGGHPIVEYSRFTDEGSWKDEFFGRGYEKELLREACPLTKNGNQHRFVHRSLLEYGLALAVFDPQGKQAKVAPERTMRRRGSESSDELSFEFEDKDEYVDQDEDDWDEQFVSLGQEPDANSPLFWRNFVKDHSLLQFLKERVRKEPLFKEQLLAYIEHSKEDKKWRTAAANAITILVRAGEQFIGTDLQGIQIPGADLSHGVFDSVKLQNADLRKVTLHGIWLRQTDLSGAQMVGVQFGEFPFLADWRMVRSFAYSPDGKSIAVGFANGSIGVYSTSELVETQTLEGHIGAVQHAVYSPTGNKIASAGKDKTVRLWDMETGSQLHALKGHKLPVLGVAYSPQRDLVASASCDKTVRLWDVNTGECCKVLSGHTKEVFSVAYSPTRNQVASCSGDRTIRLWNVETGACSHTLSGHTSIVFGVAYSRDGDQIASGSMDKAVRVWDAGTGTSLHILNGHTGAVSSVAYSPNGDRVASGSADVTVRIWDVGTESCRHILTGHQDSIYVVSYSPSGDQVASVSTDKTLRLWDASTGRARLVCSGHSAAIQSIECSPKGDLIVSGSGDNTIRLWDAETGACRQTLDGKIDAIFSVAFSKHGDLIVSGGGDNLVRLWEVKSGKCQRVMTGHTNWVNSVAFSPEGTMVASTGGDMTVRLWNVATGDCSKVLDGHTDDVLSVAYAPDSKHIVTGSKDSKIRLWDISTGKPCKVLDGHTKWVMKVVYSPQGDQLASASTDMTVRLWDVRTRKCQLTLNGHTKEVQGVAYSVNGKLVASGSTDRTVRVWDVSSGECRAKVENFPDSVYCVSWCASSDIQYLVTGCKDGSVLKWQVSEGKEQSRVQLRWSASKGALTVTGAVIKGASGLTMLDKKLLEQHGATGEPDDLYVHERDGMVLIENDM